MWEISAGLWKWCNVWSKNLSLAQNVFWRQNSCWRWASAADYNKDIWQHSTGKRTCSILSNSSHIVTMTADVLNMNRNIVRLVLAEELGMRNICAKMSPRNLTEQQRHAWLSVCADLLEQMVAGPELMNLIITVARIGFSHMIHRPNINVWNCVQRDHQDQRKHAYPSLKWNACLCASLIPWVLFTYSVFLLYRRSINITTQKFFKDWGGVSCGFVQTWRRTGSLLTTMRQPMQSYL